MVMHEAVLYEKLEGGRVRCGACKHACVIPKDQTGICGVRQNKDGKLYLIVYGKASAVNVDPIEKKPLFHFLPGTDVFSLGTVGCNFGCEFCQNWDLSQVTKELREKLTKEKHVQDMDLEVGRFGYELSPEKIVRTCVEKKLPSIAYTYNEPIIFFEYVLDTAKLAHAKGIKNVLVSNGYESDKALEMMRPFVQAINIDLKAFTEEFYRELCKANLHNVCDTIRKAHALGYHVEVTTLLIPGKNDSDKELKEIAKFIAGIDVNMPWHVSAFHPEYKLTNVPPTRHDALVRAFGIGKAAGLKYVYVGNVIDEKHESTYCPKCDALLIGRSGYDVTIGKFKEGKCTECGEKIPGVWK